MDRWWRRSQHARRPAAQTGRANTSRQGRHKLSQHSCVPQLYTEERAPARHVPKESMPVVTNFHPTPEMLVQLATGTLADPAAQRTVARHLLRRCAVCTRFLRGAIEGTGTGRASRRAAGPPADAYPEILARNFARTAAGRAAIAADAVHVLACWSLLAATPPTRRLALVAADPRFHQWPLAERLIDTAADIAREAPDAAAGACRLALAIAERLPADRYPAALLHDLRARAHALLGEALRRDGRFAGARRAIERAWQAADLGSGDPLARAALLHHQANLELALGDFAAAAALLRPAAATYRLHRQPADEGRVLYKLALAQGYEDPRRGAATARRALARIDAAADPRLDLAARHTLIWFLNDSGEEHRALDLLGGARRLYHRLGESDAHQRLPWLEARICRRLGELPAAERGLAAVWHDFRGAGLRQDLTLVSLDLVEAYLAQGKRRHALRLLASFQDTLIRWRMHQEGLAVWLLLLREAAAESARAQALTHEAALYFRRAWRRRLPFRR